jgi:hypothetical protein
MRKVGLKESFIRAYDKWWEWVRVLSEPIVWTVIWLAVAALLSLWTLLLLYLIWQALLWVWKA